MNEQATISVPQKQALALFGSVGTHSCVAGATLWLRDPFFNDRYGRKVVVQAKSRSTASRAMRTVLFQLCHDNGHTTEIKDTNWHYYDAKNAKHGPFAFSRMICWAKKDAFKDDALKVQHVGTQCWFPLWFLLSMEDQGTGNSDYQEVLMDDYEETVKEVIDERKKAGTASLSLTVAGFPELSSDETMEPMDYELSHVPGDVAPDSVRAFVVVDTNVLITHLSFTEKAFERLTAGGPRLEVVLLVPWVVLNELDKLKDGQKKAQAEGARRALKRLRLLTSERDAYIRGQTAAEHTRAVESIKLPDVVAGRQLRGDDMILQSCLHYDAMYAQAYRRSGHKAAVFLLSNDSGLCLRAGVNGIKCFTAHQFPTDAEGLAKQVPDADGADMEIGASHGPSATPSPEATKGPLELLHSPHGGPMQEVSPVHPAMAHPPPQPHHQQQHQQQYQSPVQPQPASPSSMSWSLPQFTVDELIEEIAHVAAGRPASQDVFNAMIIVNDNPALKAQLQKRIVERQQQEQKQQQQQHAQQVLQHQLAALQQQLQNQQLQQQMQQQQQQPQRLQGQLQAMSLASRAGNGHGMPSTHPALALPPQGPPTAAAGPLSSTPTPHLHPALSGGVGSGPSSPRPINPDTAAREIIEVVETCLAVGVKYYRQQDLGDLWLEMLDDDSLPPWKAETVLHIITSHDTSFWGVLGKEAKEDAKSLKRYLKQVESSSRRGGVPDRHSTVMAAGWLSRLLTEMEEATLKPRHDGDAPDPAEVPDFVSLGSTRAALKAGMDRMLVVMHI